MNITKTYHGFSISEGGVWEDKNWEITTHTNVPRSCKHENSFIVVADNEGGYNSTSVCLDCILEAAAQIKSGFHDIPS